MARNPLAIKRFRLALGLLCTCALSVIFAGCIDGGRSHRPSVGRIKTGEYSPAALGYIEAALEKPTEGYPALALTWSVIAQLDRLENAPGGSKVRAKIAEYVEQTGGRPPHELVAAWLACNRHGAVEFIKEQGAKGNWRYVAALWYQPELARDLFAKRGTRIVPDNRITPELAGRWLDMQEHWGDVKEVDKDLLVVVSERSNDPGNTLRAAGWILRLEPENQRFIDYLELGLKRAKPGMMVELMGTAEGIKISRNPELTDMLVPVVKSIQIKGESPPEGQRESDEANSQQLLISYALTYLPGEQASLMRNKLARARDPRIQWQARLGELLHGNPEPWEEALGSAPDLTDPSILVSLDKLDSPEPVLLPTYQRLAESTEASLRIVALDKLGRFRPYAEDKTVSSLVIKLTQDKVPEVRATAWYVAGKLGIGDPLEALGNKDEAPEVRLAAAYAALMHAQGGPPELRDAKFWSISDPNSKSPKAQVAEPNQGAGSSAGEGQAQTGAGELTVPAEGEE